MTPIINNNCKKEKSAKTTTKRDDVRTSRERENVKTIQNMT
jgi:hypothetical protein